MPAETSIRTGREEFDSLVPRVRGFLEQDVLEVTAEQARAKGLELYFDPDPTLPDMVLGDCELTIEDQSGDQRDGYTDSPHPDKFGYE